MRKYWTNTAGGAFETSGNWSPAGAPGENDLAIITAIAPPNPTPPPPRLTYTVTVSADTTVLGVSLGADPPPASPANVALFGNYIAAGFPEPAATPWPSLLAGHEAVPLLLAAPQHGA